MHPLPKLGSKRKQYFLVYKPYGILSQFTDKEGRRTIRELGEFPRDVYPVGRLDMDSEGLLLLTNDNEVNHRMTDPRFAHARTYLVQIEGIPSNEALERLRHGVALDGKSTKLALVRLLDSEPTVPERHPPIRKRKSIPTSWIEITLREGRNRQVRKMSAAAGHPTLRLLRTGMGILSVGEMRPGEIRLLTEEEAQRLRKSLEL